MVTASRAELAWMLAHARKPGVQGDEQVQALLLADLPDDDPRRPHPQRLFHQCTQSDLAGPLQARLPGLQRDHVRERHLQLVSS